ncbi:hypothetical protein LDG_6124 [Legionella drancourtii LLAP12]|uniref:Uncharacterized protein n=1 Tax=Legionella drancourtii LLAP12 TaxID=658187 RepID=G9EL65_9GAMM|nr:hypothetical protein LDG_6124 [Legionella drancourtii LLAP12]
MVSRVWNHLAHHAGTVHDAAQHAMVHCFFNPCHPLMGL